MLKNANLPLNSSPFEPKIQSAPCPKQTFPAKHPCAPQTRVMHSILGELNIRNVRFHMGILLNSFKT